MRQVSGLHILEDTFKRLLILSDPYLSSMHRIPNKKVKNYSPVLLLLLQITKTSTKSTSDTEKSESSEDEDEI